MPDAAYYRAWRAAHPDYLARERERMRARKRSLTPAQRRTERGPERRCVVPCEPIPPLHCGCDMFDHAKSIAKVSNGYRFLEHPYYDDLVSEIVLALLEKRSAAKARRDFLDLELAWLRRVIQVRDGFEPRDGRLIIQDLED